MTLEAGARVGPYEILSLVAVGGMGEVYRARDSRLGRDVALKRLPVSARADPERLKRFELEARATGSLNHPNILALYDVGVHDQTPYVVSELLEGQTLGERLTAGPLAVRKVLEYARQLAQGLAAAHDRGIIHRDLKPENVFVTRDGVVKILDFGLARLVSDEGPVPKDDAVTAGRVLGTVGYMSPEQVRGEPADQRSDIFSFGAVLHEMLTGRRAFRGVTAIETLNAILKEDPASLGSVALPPGLDRAVWHCLEKRPEERFQSARDLAFGLETLSSVSLPALPALVKAGGRRAAGAKVAWFALGALAAAGVTALVARTPPEAPVYERLTFRRGTIESARLAPDGQTVVYGAAWAGQPLEVFAGRLGSPESKPLGFVSAEILALSSKGEMALSLGRKRIGTFVGTGTLARLPLAGGAPREVLEDVQEADWTPDGTGLAVVRSIAGRNRLEYPVGTVLYETAGWVSNPRFSPGGDQIAFLDHPVPGDDGGNVAIVGLDGTVRTLCRNWGSLQGLAWPPGGGEVWFTGTRVGSARSLNAVTLEGRERVVTRMAGVLTLHDIAGNGRVLFSHSDQRREVVGRAAGAEERNLSWLDYCFPSDFADDGSTVFFAENGEGGGPGYSVYVRGTDGAPAVRLGEGAAMALSPDGKLALANRNYTSDTPELVLLPTGSGQARPLPRGGVNTQAATFFPDGRHLLLVASPPNGATRVYAQDLEGGEPRALTPEGTRFELSTRPISADGKQLVLQDAGGRHVLFPAEGGEPLEVPGLEPADRPIRWSPDGRWLYAYRPGEVPARVFRLELATGRRVPWLNLAPHDLSGVLAVNPVLLAANGKGYVFGYRRVLSDLYAATGLR